MGTLRQTWQTLEFYNEQYSLGHALLAHQL
jgi:hypothetical protein